jgi:type III secretion protein Q
MRIKFPAAVATRKAGASTPEDLRGGIHAPAQARGTDAWADLEHSRFIPRLDASTVSSLNEVYRSRKPLVFDVRGVRCSLYWDFQRQAQRKERKYRFTLGQQEAYLGLDEFAESILLGGERHAGLLPRELRYLLVADALHPLVQHAEAVLGQPFEWDPPEADEERVCVCDPNRAALFRIVRHDTGASCGGFIQFSDDAALAPIGAVLGRHRAPVANASFDWLRFPLSCRVGTTRMSLREMQSIEPGDIISVDEWRSSGSGLFITAQIHGRPGAEISGVAEGTRITVQHWSENIMQSGNPHSTEAAAQPNGPAVQHERLDGLEVPLQFEIGDLSVALADLKNVQPGYVFELPQPLSRGVVRILAHGSVLGTGSLVAVGDRLGVRVSEFVAAEHE